MKLQTAFIQKIKEVTEDHYNEMLGCLPPERMTSNAFLVGEPTDHAIVANEHASLYQARYALYFIEDDHYYYGGLCTVYGFDMFIIPETKQYSIKDRIELNHPNGIGNGAGTL